MVALRACGGHRWGRNMPDSLEAVDVPDDRPRKKSSTAKRRVDADFLPAALEVLEKPPSPIGRMLIWLIMAAATAAVVWAAIAQIDIVAVAEGRIHPRARLQSIEAPEAGVIRDILVREGQRVDQGEPLLAFDPTYADADGASARIEYATANLARARAEALLRHAEGLEAAFTPPEGVDPASAAAEADAVRARIAALDAERAGIDQKIAGARASQLATESEKQKLLEMLPLDEEAYGIMQRLGKEGLTPRPQMIEMEKRLVQLRRDIEVRTAEIEETQAEVASLRRDRARLLEEFRGRAAAEKAEAEAIVATRAEGVRKATAREGYQTLNAPVAGTINEITVTTVGEVAEAGAPLITLVPEGEELIVEALALNRDAGFVRSGQTAIVKVEAYPFTRHGYVEGVVEHISPDAIADEARGLVFPVRVKLVKGKLREAGPACVGEFLGQVRDQGVSSPEVSADVDKAKPLPGRPGVVAPCLSPGMSTQVEIITGRRTVLDYLLSPIARAASEAGRER
jgi:hemolysin D